MTQASSKVSKLPFGAVGLCWFEELDQFDGPEEVRNVEQTVLRGGSWTLTLKSFNPPAMAGTGPTATRWSSAPASWSTTPPTAICRRKCWAHGSGPTPSTCKGRTRRPIATEYGGEVVGSGAAVFENLQLRAVTDAEIERFDWVYHGVDWGWYPDPGPTMRCIMTPRGARW